MNYYTYVWLRKDCSPYYVGKGCGNRAYDRRRRSVHPPEEKWRVLIYPQPSEAEAFEHEKFLVAIFGRKDNGTGVLYNRTDGGEKPPPTDGPHTEEHKGKLRASNIETYKSQAIRDKISRANKGRIRSAETRRKLSEIGKTLVGPKNPFFGKRHSEEAKEKNRAGHLGRKHSPETRKKMSDSHHRRSTT